MISHKLIVKRAEFTKGGQPLKKKQRASFRGQEPPKKLKKKKKNGEKPFNDFFEKGDFRSLSPLDESFWQSMDADKEFGQKEFFESLGIDQEDVRGCFCASGNENVCQDKINSLDYRYLFTNHEFIYFLATIDPIEFTVVITVLSIIFTCPFNLEELFILNRFLHSFADGIEIILNQRINLRLVCDMATANESNSTLQTQLDLINQNYQELLSRIGDLESITQTTGAGEVPTEGTVPDGFGSEDTLLELTEEN